jgi:uncharacterized protein (TIGR03086 family)
MTDWLHIQRLAHERFTETLEAITDWSAPTPDAEWDVAALVAHVIEEQQWVPLLLDGRRVAEARTRIAPLGPDLTDEWRRHSGLARAAWERADLAAAVRLSSDTVPARDYLTEQVADVIVHSWDLARATGADERLDDELVDAAWSVFEPQRDALEASGLYASPLPIPAEAPLQLRLLALTGRDARLAA